MAIRSTIIAVVGALSVFLFWLPTPVAAQGFERQVLNRLIANGVPAREAASVFDDVLYGIYQSVARANSRRTWFISERYARSAARIVLKLPGMQNYVLNNLPYANGGHISSYRAALRAGSSRLTSVVRSARIGNPNISAYIDDVFHVAEAVSKRIGCLSGCSVVRSLRHRATAGGHATLRRIGSSMASRFGAFLEWMSTTTAQRILGVYTIGTYTQGHINEALFAYQDEMEAIGDAAEIEAFNNNVRLMMERLKDGRLVLVPGMTLSQAVRRLRRNMNRGGPYFANIVRKPGGGPGRRTGRQALPNGRYKSSYGMVTLSCSSSGRCNGSYKGAGDNKPARIMGSINRSGLLTGIWAEVSSGRKCRTAKGGSRYWGKIAFKFDATANSWTGGWGYCEARPSSSNWSGRRQVLAAGGHTSSNVSRSRRYGRVRCPTGRVQLCLGACVNGWCKCTLGGRCR